MTSRQIKSFQKKIWDYYKENGRSLPWRAGKRMSLPTGQAGFPVSLTPYHIVVSEIMLQQTQVGRVIVKYDEFIQRFPTSATLAKASVAEVLSAWQGLGYNCRALALKKIAERVEGEYGGKFPKDPEILKTFPGIGEATASSVAAFAFNIPVVFIETNIRSVFIHFFFKDHGMVHDKELLPYVESSLDIENPREWYWALMDYGTMLKEKYPNPSRRSAHYTKQKPFKESDRYIRGQIIKILTTHQSITLTMLTKKIDRASERIQKCLTQLEQEGFIVNTKRRYTLVK